MIPNIIVRDKKLPVKNGKGIYKLRTTKTGKFTENGNLQFESPATGEMLHFPFEIKYEVFDK